MNWHEFARQYRKCFVSVLQGSVWTVYLPDGSTASGTFDHCRDMAGLQGCTILL